MNRRVGICFKLVLMNTLPDLCSFKINLTNSTILTEMNRQSEVEVLLDLVQINYNKTLFEGLQCFKDRKIPEAIRKFTSLLRKQEGTADVMKIALIQSNLGVLYFYNYEYKQAYDIFEEALNNLTGQNSFDLYKHPTGRSLAIKILVQMALLSLPNLGESLHCLHNQQQLQEGEASKRGGTKHHSQHSEGFS